MHIYITSLCIYDKPLSESGACLLSQCVHKIKDLGLDLCDISTVSVAALAEEIALRKTPVRA